jgi:hypothetical protein
MPQLIVANVGAHDAAGCRNFKYIGGTMRRKVLFLTICERSCPICFADEIVDDIDIARSAQICHHSRSSVVDVSLREAFSFKKSGGDIA